MMKRRTFLGGMIAAAVTALVPGCFKPRPSKPSPATLTANRVRAHTDYTTPPYHPDCRCLGRHFDTLILDNLKRGRSHPRASAPGFSAQVRLRDGSYVSFNP